MLLCLSIIFLIVIISCWIYFDVRKPKYYPPGPSWFPLIGCYFQVRAAYSKKNYYHLVWTHFHDLYGSVVGLKLGTDKIVIVSGYEAIQQVMFKKEFQGRPDGYFFRLRSFGERLGIVFVEGAFMREQKKFCLQLLKQFGFGKNIMYEIITEEALKVTDLIFSKHKEGPIEIQHLFNVSILNTIWTMLAGQRFSLDDKKLLKLLELVHEGFHLVDISGGILNQMPFLRFIIPSLSGYNNVKTIVDEIIMFLKHVIKSHQQQNCSNDFIGEFLKAVKNRKNQPNNFTEKQLLIILEDLFMAGTETTGSTLSFIIFYLIKYPSVQQKIHTELDRVVNSEIPSIEHREKLVYLEAAIMEVQRHANPVPVAIPHTAMEDTELMSHKIPKGAFLLPSLWGLHMEESYWGDPHNFRPERFIVNGKIYPHSGHFMPFGTGKRRCIGEILAKTSLFLFTANLLHRFELHPCSSDFSVNIVDGVTLALSPFKVKFIPRR